MFQMIDIKDTYLSPTIKDLFEMRCQAEGLTNTYPPAPRDGPQDTQTVVASQSTLERPMEQMILQIRRCLLAG